MKYVNVEADKKYQVADWRLRPLPTEMLTYARSDTHSLLYVYDQLRRDFTARSKELDRDLLTPLIDDNMVICSRELEIECRNFVGINTEN